MLYIPRVYGSKNTGTMTQRHYAMVPVVILCKHMYKNCIIHISTACLVYFASQRYGSGVILATFIAQQICSPYHLILCSNKHRVTFSIFEFLLQRLIYAFIDYDCVCYSMRVFNCVGFLRVSFSIVFILNTYWLRFIVG